MSQIEVRDDVQHRWTDGELLWVLILVPAILVLNLDVFALLVLCSVCVYGVWAAFSHQ